MHARLHHRLMRTACKYVTYVIFGSAVCRILRKLGTALGSFTQNQIPIFGGQGERMSADLSSHRS